jgi:hypothetical protein
MGLCTLQVCLVRTFGAALLQLLGRKEDERRTRQVVSKKKGENKVKPPLHRFGWIIPSE